MSASDLFERLSSNLGLLEKSGPIFSNPFHNSRAGMRLTPRLLGDVFLRQHYVNQQIPRCTHFRRKIMTAVRMLDAQAVFMAMKLENRTRRAGDAVHAIGAEIRVAGRGDDENVSRRQGAD